GFQHVALLGLGWTTLLSCPWDQLSFTRVFDGPFSSSQNEIGQPIPKEMACNESVWTFGTDARDAKKLAYSVILRDLAAAPPADGRRGPQVVIAEDWWIYRLLEFLSLRRPDIKVIPYFKMGTHIDQFRQHLVEELRKGAYAVAYPNRD